MKINQILKTTDHRPWKLPSTKWKFYQEWNNTLFIHWPVDLTELKRLVPEQLEIDLFEGRAWISLVVFRMKKIRPKNFPAFPPISNFDEINIRTYVKYKGKAGVQFLSIEAASKFSCHIATNLSQLPYRYSKMSRKKETFKSWNSIHNDKLELQYKIGQKLNDKLDLDKWLTERYALFQDFGNTINKFEIHHLEWPIFKVELIKLHCCYPRFSKLMRQEASKVHYSPGVQVIAWDKIQSE